MAKITLYLDTRSQKQNGTFPVKIKLSHKTKAKMESTGVSVKKTEWDNENGEIIGNTSLKKQQNLRLKRELLQLQMGLMEVESVRDISRLTIDELMNEIRRKAGIEVKQKENTLFVPFFMEQIKKKKAPGTAKTYRTTLNRIKIYDDHAENLRFEDITESWLKGYEEWMLGKKLKKNSVWLDIKNIKCVFNEARLANITTSFPFIKYKVKKEETRHRVLGIETMHQIWNMEAKGVMRLFIDMFKLSFALLGINPTDLYSAKKEQIVAGRLEYRRSKTSKLYSVKIYPEAMELLKKYEGKGENLLEISDRYNSVHTFCNHWNEGLKKVSKGLSAYWARHTWATIAAELDLPNETISGALGHRIGSSVTSIYIRFDQRKIDKANRRVLDAVIRGEIPEGE